MNVRATALFFLSTFVFMTTGCMPETEAPVVEGTLGTNTASQLAAKIRSKNGNKYSVPHKVNDKEFTANWEISNSLKKSSQLQIKPPSDWELADVYQALDTVLQAHETKPWYGTIDETVLRLMRRASEDVDERAEDMAPETPYHVAVKVKQHTSEWFLEVKVQIMDDDGPTIGF